MLVALSDIHLGDRAANRTGFVDFIERYLKPNASDISGVYLLGDILDLWRKNTSSVILDNLEILNKLCSLGFQVYYIVGNHDFIMSDLETGASNDNASLIRNGTINNLILCSSQVAAIGNRVFRFIHGHQIDYWYALPFYEAFCRAMCRMPVTSAFHTSVWSLVQEYSENLNPIVASRIARLSKDLRRRIELKLAGPLDGQMMSKEESAVVELDLLSPFIEIDSLCPESNQNVRFDNVRNEIRQFCDNAANQNLEFRWIESLARTESEGTPEELVNQFLLTWADVHRWMYEKSKNESLSEKRTQLLLHLKRIVAMLTVNLQPHEILIHGHGHQSHVDETIHDVDTGCWLRDSGSFFTIEKDALTLSKWP
jgi:UDP-2,3-diacylglucosamine pyrophosphatase LpxH